MREQGHKTPARIDELVPFCGDGHYHHCFDYRKVGRSRASRSSTSSASMSTKSSPPTSPRSFISCARASRRWSRETTRRSSPPRWPRRPERSSRTKAIRITAIACSGHAPRAGPGPGCRPIGPDAGSSVATTTSTKSSPPYARVGRPLPRARGLRLLPELLKLRQPGWQDGRSRVGEAPLSGAGDPTGRGLNALAARSTSSRRPRQAVGRIDGGANTSSSNLWRASRMCPMTSAATSGRSTPTHPALARTLGATCRAIAFRGLLTAPRCRPRPRSAPAPTPPPRSSRPQVRPPTDTPAPRPDIHSQPARPTRSRADPTARSAQPRQP